MTRSRHHPAGGVTATYTVWCGACLAKFTARADTARRAAENEWMGHGWCRFAGAWHCPACSAAHIFYSMRHV